MINGTKPIYTHVGLEPEDYQHYADIAEAEESTVARVMRRELKKIARAVRQERTKANGADKHQAKRA